MFSKRLKQLRLRKKLSQQRIADMLGISRQGYGKYEDGQSEPDQQSLIKLADFYDVSIDYLIGHTDIPHRNEDDKRDAIIHKIATEFPNIDLMFKDMENMTAEDFEDIYNYIKFKKSQKDND